MTYIQITIIFMSIVLLSPVLAEQTGMEDISRLAQKTSNQSADDDYIHPTRLIFHGIDQTRLLFAGVFNGVLASTLFRISNKRGEIDRKYIAMEVVGLVSALMSGAGVVGIAYCYYADLGARVSAVTAWGVGSVVGFVSDRIVPSAIRYFECKVDIVTKERKQNKKSQE